MPFENEHDDFKKLEIVGKKFPGALCNLIIGVNDGCYELVDPSNTHMEVKPVDISKIDLEIHQVFGNAVVRYTIGSGACKDVVSKDNQSGRSIWIQSFSNPYIHEYPERFGNAPLAKLSYDDWREKMISIARFLRNVLEQKGNVVLYFDDLPNGDAEKVTV